MEGQCHPDQYRSILRGSDSPTISKYSVENKSKKNCFMMYARGFSIAWADNNSYWKWVTEKDVPSDAVLVEMAELLKVCWLEVHSKFDVSNLCQATTYEVVFVIKLASSGDGWEVPVNFRVTLPGGNNQERQENLKEKPREEWIEITAGEVNTLECKEGEMEVSMFETEGGKWKRGLVLRGVLIRPKNK
ncbi:hypothetical protein NL676_009204 [Syzygium grande]|nr:hypothetical protein NL676_009204 [Syzygium grande]